MKTGGAMRVVCAWSYSPPLRSGWYIHQPDSGSPEIVEIRRLRASDSGWYDPREDDHGEGDLWVRFPAEKNFLEKQDVVPLSCCSGRWIPMNSLVETAGSEPWPGEETGKETAQEKWVFEDQRR